ncbi:uncharacterized protein LOC143470328 isoform X2 [Clavelina lepadiformis]|uniref:uncharacterized protein LOC143470328 isoform X2 n=1 Tax=Clavelina lepadiformis TaxID=159417 RepID=UPI0040434A5C
MATAESTEPLEEIQKDQVAENVSDEGSENPAYETQQEEGDSANKDVVGLGSILKAKRAASKWKDLHRTRRADYDAMADHSNAQLLGLDDSSTDSELNFDEKQPKISNANQQAMNKKLISYFVKLAKNNHANDEIDLEFVGELISKGADINCYDKHGQGMLHEAARVWHTDIVKFLLDHGADISIKDRFHRTPLHVAAAVDYPEMVELLIEKGCLIDSRTKDEEQTPLHYAARNDAVESLKVLLKLGAEVEVKDYKGRTPLFVAAELDRSETAKYLVEANADATVVDNYGQLCMTYMITKMGPVARSALDQFHRKDRANRKQYFFLNRLESPHLRGEMSSMAKNPLEVIVTYRQLDLIMHPVITRLIDVKWEQFGRRHAFQTLAINFIFILIWTILGVGVPWYLRYQYIFPQDWWRLFLLVLGCLMTLYYVVTEIREIVSSRKKFRKWKHWREDQINMDRKFCHPKWPEEERYLKGEINLLDDMLPFYFKDFWNYFDWAVYVLIFILVITHIIDASLPSSEGSCCTSDGTTEVCASNATFCSSGFVNNRSLTTWNNRIFVITVILLWLRLMKFTRAFRFLGPFIVMLGKIVWDIIRFLYLYLEFYIPYACAFWMIFGNIESIPSMFTVDQMLFSLYRITLVDDYQFDEMRAFDVVMAYILIGTFLGISAILCINLFIALLSDTFQRVYDNANANAVMQQASLILNIEENLGDKSKKQFKKHIAKKCSPECMYYDDDLTVVQGADLKKVTIQIKEQMNELLEYVHKAETEQRLAQIHDSLEPEGQHVDQQIHRFSVQDDIGGFTTPRSSRLKPTAKSIRLHDVFGLATKKTESSPDGQVLSNDMNKLSFKMTEISSRLKTLQVSQAAQEESYQKLRGDMRDIKRMLTAIVPGEVVFEDDEDQARGKKSSFRSKAKLFTAPGPRLSVVSEQASHSSSIDTSSFVQRVMGKSKKSSGSSDTSGLLSRVTSVESQGGTTLPHVELVPLPGATAGSGYASSVQGQSVTVAGVRTIDVKVNSLSESSEVAPESDSNV